MKAWAVITSSIDECPKHQACVSLFATKEAAQKCFEGSVAEDAATYDKKPEWSEDRTLCVLNAGGLVHRIEQIQIQGSDDLSPVAGACIRREYDCKYRMLDGHCVNPCVTRIRAAQRETAIGNAAAMRDALKQVVGAFEDGKLGAVGNRPSNYALALVRRVIRKCRSALAAPPRNCDRFATGDEAVEAWVPGASDDLQFLDWLFMPADGAKEGGAE